jgi:iron complex outermembrane receptor protein
MFWLFARLFRFPSKSVCICLSRFVWPLSGWLLVFIAMASGYLGFAVSEAKAEEAGSSSTQSKARASCQSNMEDIVVSATRSSVDTDNAPASATVITRETLDKRIIRTVDDALKYEAGIYTQRARGLADSTPAVTMRGLSSQGRTLVLVNGVPYQDGYSNSVNWNSIPTDSIDRIEIVRGPGSSVYGGNAMGGVINIITKVPMKTEMMGRAGVGTGWSNLPDTKTQFYDYRFGANAGTRLKDTFSLFGGFESEYNTGYPGSLVVKPATTSGNGALTGGYPAQSASGGTSWVVGDGGNTSGVRQVANALAAWDLTDTGRLRADILFGHQGYDYGRPNSYVGAMTGTVKALPGYRTSALAPGNFLAGKGETDTYRLALGYDELFFGDLSFKFKGAFLRSFNRYTQPDSSSSLGYDQAPGTYSQSTRDMWFLDAQGSYPLFKGNTLTLGGTFRKDVVDIYDANMASYLTYGSLTNKTTTTSGTSNNWAVFAEDEWKFHPNWTLYGGMRVDFWVAYDGKSGNVGSVSTIPAASRAELSPRLALVWTPLEDTSLRASVSKGFRAPNLYEMLRAFTSSGTSSITYLPNPGLQPETLWTYEIGGTQYLWERRIKACLSLYHTDFSNYIDSVNVTSSSKRKENIGKVALNGVEAELSVKPLDWLTLWGNLAVNDSTIVSFDGYPQYVGKKLPTVPALQANLGADFAWKQWKLSVSGNYAGKTYSNYANNDVFDAYGTYSSNWLCDAKLTYSPTKYTDVIVSITNIFNEKYFRYYAGQPTMGMVELKVKF